jgi:hypothetical protein
MRMTPYLRLSGDSGVLAYRIEAQAIRVKFADGKIYIYTYASTGRVHVERMKLLAQAGRGLSTYISKYVRDAYAERSG